MQNKLLDIDADCTCYGVKSYRLKEIIRYNKCKSPNDVKKICRAGSACGMCVPYIERYIKEENDNKNSNI